MRKLFVLVSVVLVAVITFVGLNSFVGNSIDSLALDFDDSGFPPLVRV